MAGKKDIVEQALKLITGGSEDAAKLISNIQRSDPFPVDYIEPGSLRYKYEHPDTGSFMEIITRPKGARSASVIGLEVPEEYRGAGIGKALQERVLKDFPSLMGQVSSKAAAVNAYKAGRRPIGNPNATLEDVQTLIDEYLKTHPKPTFNSGGSVREGYGPGGIIDDVVRLAGKVISGEGDEAAQAGIRAYHGSPHDFDKFDMSKIGTGEGAQAYGHGLYFAENEDVGKGYRDSLGAKANPTLKVGDDTFKIIRGGIQPGSKEDLLHRLWKGRLEFQSDYPDLTWDNELTNESVDVALAVMRAPKETKDWAISTLKNKNLELPNFGHMYEVNIAADPNTFLDWDKPLSEQPDIYEKLKSSGKLNVNEAVVAGTEKRLISLAGQLGINDLVPIRVQSGLRRGLSLSDALTEAKGATQNPEWSAQVDKLAEAILPTGVEMKGNLPQNLTGQSLVDSKVNGLTKRQVSEILSKEGIPGIKYLDAGSRGAGDGTRNYVVFDDKLISIIRKYGIAGASAMLGYNLMERLDPKQALAATMADQDYKAGQLSSDTDDIDDALRIAKDVGGGIGPVFMTDAKGINYDIKGNIIPPEVTGPNPARSEATPEQVGQRAAQDPATFDALMERYAVPDQDIARYEAAKAEVAKQPYEIQQMTHVGAPPMRDVKVDMPLFGGEQKITQAPYNVASGLSGMAQTAYDFKTAPLYMTPWTAPIGAGLDVAEGVATADPLQASLAALGAPGKYAKAAIIGGSNYFMSPAEAQAGPARWFSKAMEVARDIPMNKMTGEQALAMLRKGTSPEELKWTGTDVFLSGKKSVSKDELLDYLEKNRVQLNQINLGGSNKPTRLENIDIIDIPSEIRDRHPEVYSLSNRVEELRNELVKLRSMPDQSGLDYYDNFRAVSQEFSKTQADLVRVKDAIRKEYVESIGGLGRPTKYGPDSSHGETLTTPGGKNYSENLYALPQKDIYTPFVDQMRKDVWAENYREAIEGGFTEERARAFADKFNNLKPHELAKFLNKEDELESVLQAQKSYEPQYKGGHWSDVSPDVLFHTRTSELTYEPPGANRPYRVHSIEESQSDPGQAGRKTGFKDQKAMAEVARLRQQTQDLKAKLKSEQARLYDEHQKRIAPYVDERVRYERELRDKYKKGEISLGDMNRLAEAYVSPEPELTGKYRADTYQILNPILDQIASNEAEINRIGSKIGEIPMMPFISNTDAWTDRAIKHELDKAFDNGSDYFSWTPGEVHSERYDLSRHIRRIDYNPDDGSLIAYNPEGRMVVNESVNDPSELDEYIGEELAQKLRAEYDNRRFTFDEYEIDRDDETGEWSVSLYGEPLYDYNGEPLLFRSKGEARDYLNEMMANEFAEQPVTLSGLDIKTGGEGMIGYYDKIFLKRVQEVIRKATGQKPVIETIEVQTANGPRKQLGIRLTDEMREKARFSDFKKGGRVTGGNTYGNDNSVAHALALTSEY